MGGGAVHRGRRGEEVAARALTGAGWTVVDRNWRDGPRELDLVARRGTVLAFVEVKTRGAGSWGHPLESLTRRKRREVERAARAWLRVRGPELRDGSPPGIHPGAPAVVRFDAVVVWWDSTGAPAVEHVPDAWRPGWDPR